MKKHTLTILNWVLFLGVLPSWGESPPGPYFGQTLPGASPEKFIMPPIDSLPNFLESRIAFSPDGNECLFSGYRDWDTPGAQMYYSQDINNVWTSPVKASFLPSSGRLCSHPFFSVDGNSLFFSKNGDIWMVHRTAQGWSNAQVLPAPINTSAYEGTYSQATDGTGYLESGRAGGQGATDVWCIPPTLNDQKKQAKNPGAPINSGIDDGSPFIDPNGRFLLFVSNPAGKYKDNLYVTFSDGNGGWSTPVNLNQFCPGINTDSQEYAPKLSPDGRFLFFTRMNYDTQQGGIYWVQNPIPDPNGEDCVIGQNTEEAIQGGEPVIMDSSLQ